MFLCSNRMAYAPFATAFWTSSATITWYVLVAVKVIVGTSLREKVIVGTSMIVKVIVGSSLKAQIISVRPSARPSMPSARPNVSPQVVISQEMFQMLHDVVVD